MDRVYIEKQIANGACVHSYQAQEMLDTIDALQSQLSTALSEKSAYREALREIADETEIHTKLSQFRLCCKFQDIARRALDRGPEKPDVPPLVESTLTDEQRKEIGETCRREVRESWEKIKGGKG